MTATAENGWALSVSCLIDASPEAVWQVMTERMEEWWCPLPWRTEVLEQDWRAGGTTRMVMRGPNGEEHPHTGIFLEVVPGVRWVATDAVQRSDDGTLMPSGPFMLGSWEIAPEAGGTRYTATGRHWNEETARQHEAMGFTDGWAACAAQLKALCEA